MHNRIIELCLRFRWLRWFLNRIKAREIANFWLRRVPSHRRLPHSSVRYRRNSLDCFLVEREIFGQRAYGELGAWGPIRTFADLGCNCGYFTCFLASELSDDGLKGLLIDANPQMVADSQWHADANNWRGIRAVWGLLGLESSEPAGCFYLHPDAAGSSRFAEARPENVTQNRWQQIKVPALLLQEEWRNSFGDEKCDLLKIDIEGSEGSFIERELAFIRKVKLLVIEFHGWLVDVPALHARLTLECFELERTLFVDGEAEVRLYVNRSLVPDPVS